MPTRKKTAPRKTAARKEPKPKARKPSNTLSDRINVIGRTVIDIEQAVKDIQSQLASLSQPTVEQAAPQPIGLQPGDYTDASKETADALTAMGWKWIDGILDKDWPYIKAYPKEGKFQAVQKILCQGVNYTPAEFLSRAAVTAKELGLVPVEPWVPKVGEWVVVINAHSFDGWVNGDLFQVSQVEPDTDCYPDRSRYGSICYPFPPHRLRPATDAEVQQHLAEQEARANAEKVAKLKWGVRVKTQKGREYRIACDKPNEEGLYRVAPDVAYTYDAPMLSVDEFTVIDPQP